MSSRVTGGRTADPSETADLRVLTSRELDGQEQGKRASLVGHAREPYFAAEQAPPVRG